MSGIKITPLRNSSIDWYDFSNGLTHPISGDLATKGSHMAALCCIRNGGFYSMPFYGSIGDFTPEKLSELKEKHEAEFAASLPEMKDGE